MGFRTTAGVLSKLESFQTMAIPRMVRGKEGAWDPQVCLAWGDQFLSWVRAVISTSSSATFLKPASTSQGDRSAQESTTTTTDTAEETHGDSSKEDDQGAEAEEDSERSVWRVTFTPLQGVHISKLNTEAARDVASDSPKEGEKGEKRVGFLPRWYWDEVHAKRNRKPT